MAWYQWQPYVTVAQRKENARKAMVKLRKKGHDIRPVEIKGRKIAKTFWGMKWCDHLESFSDYNNRLPRGRTYVRNGSVCHLSIKKGKIVAKVSGSSLYDIKVKIEPLDKQKWKNLKQQCTGQIDSLLELLQGKLSESIMSVVTDRSNGLFPLENEISFDCGCPDWAVMCKHVAAVLYGIGARLDDQPELLFLLRGVDHEELIAADAETAVNAAIIDGSGKRLDADHLSDIFGVDIENKDVKSLTKKTKAKKSSKKKTAKQKKSAKKTERKGVTKKKSTKKKATQKKAVKKKTTPKKAVKKKATRKRNNQRKRVPKKKTPKKVVKKSRTKKKGTKKKSSSSATSTRKKNVKKKTVRRK